MAMDESSLPPYQSTTRPASPKCVRSPYTILTNIHSITGFGRILNAVITYLLKSRYPSRLRVNAPLAIASISSPCIIESNTKHPLQSAAKSVAGQQVHGRHQCFRFESEDPTNRFKFSSYAQDTNDQGSLDKQVIKRCHSQPNIISNPPKGQPLGGTSERRETSMLRAREPEEEPLPSPPLSADDSHKATAPHEVTHRWTDRHIPDYLATERDNALGDSNAEVFEICCDDTKVKSSCLAVEGEDMLTPQWSNQRVARSPDHCRQTGASAGSHTRDHFGWMPVYEERSSNCPPRILGTQQQWNDHFPQEGSGRVVPERPPRTKELDNCSRLSSSPQSVDEKTFLNWSETLRTRTSRTGDEATATKPEALSTDETTWDIMPSPPGKMDVDDDDGYAATDALSINCNQPMVTRTGLDSYKIRKDNKGSMFQDRFPSIGEDVPPWEMVCNQPPSLTAGAPERQDFPSTIPPINTGFDSLNMTTFIRAPGVDEDEVEAHETLSKLSYPLRLQQPFIRYSERPASVKAEDIFLGNAPKATSKQKTTASVSIKNYGEENSNRQSKKCVSDDRKTKKGSKSPCGAEGSSKKAKVSVIKKKVRRPTINVITKQKQVDVAPCKKSPPRRREKLSKQSPEIKLQKDESSKRDNATKVTSQAQKNAELPPITINKSPTVNCDDCSEADASINSRISGLLNATGTPKSSTHELLQDKSKDKMTRSFDSKTLMNRCSMTQITSNEYNPTQEESCNLIYPPEGMTSTKQKHTAHRDDAGMKEETGHEMSFISLATDLDRSQCKDSNPEKSVKGDTKDLTDSVTTEPELEPFNNVDEIIPSSKQSEQLKSPHSDGGPVPHSILDGSRILTVRDQVEMIEKGHIPSPSNLEKGNPPEMVGTFPGDNLRANYSYPTPSLLEYWIDSVTNFDLLRAAKEDAKSEINIQGYSIAGCNSTIPKPLTEINTDEKECDDRESLRTRRSENVLQLSDRERSGSVTDDSRNYSQLSQALDDFQGVITETSSSESDDGLSDEFQDALSTSTLNRRQRVIASRNVYGVHATSSKTSSSATTHTSSLESLYKTITTMSHTAGSEWDNEMHRYIDEVDVKRNSQEQIGIKDRLCEENRQDIRTIVDSATFSIDSCGPMTYTVEEKLRRHFQDNKGSASKSPENGKSKKRIPSELYEKQKANARKRNKQEDDKQKASKMKPEKGLKHKERNMYNFYRNSGQVRPKGHRNESKGDFEWEELRYVSNKGHSPSPGEMAKSRIENGNQEATFKLRDQIPHYFNSSNCEERQARAVPHPVVCLQLIDSANYTSDKGRLVPCGVIMNDINSYASDGKSIDSSVLAHKQDLQKPSERALRKKEKQAKPKPHQTPSYDGGRHQEFRKREYAKETRDKTKYNVPQTSPTRQNRAEKTHRNKKGSSSASPSAFWHDKPSHRGIPERSSRRDCHNAQKLRRHASLGKLNHDKPVNPMTDSKGYQRKPFPTSPLSLKDFFHDIDNH